MASRNQRGLAERLMGIRRVDASTGGPISVRSAIVYQLVTGLVSGVTQGSGRAAQQRRSQQLKDLEPAVKDIRQRHGDDKTAIEREMAELYRSHDVKFFSVQSCLLPLAGAIAMALPALWTRRRQTIPDRLAGIIVVRV